MRTVLRVVLVLAIIAGILFATDSIIRMLSEQQAATTLRQQLQLATDPKVELGGTPFSTAFLSRSVPSATITIAELPLDTGEQHVTLTDVAATTGQVQVGTGSLQAQDVHATASLSYDDVSTLAGVPVTYGGDGRLKVEYRAEVFNQTLTASASVVPVADPSTNQIRLTEPKLAVGELELGGQVLDQLAQSLVKPIDVPLPYGLRLSTITPRQDAVGLVVDAAEVTIPLG